MNQGLSKVSDLSDEQLFAQLVVPKYASAFPVPAPAAPSVHLGMDLTNG